MKSLSIVGLYFILIFFLCSCNTYNPRNDWNDANVFSSRGEYIRANKLYDKIIKEQPDNIPALINRGVNKSMLNDYTGAIKDYLAILEYDSTNTLSLVNLGNNYKRLENYNKAIDCYTKALKTKGSIKSDSLYIEFLETPFSKGSSPYNVRQYEIEFERGISYLKSDKYKLAIADLEQPLKYNFEPVTSICYIGEAYYNLNDTINARLYLEEASKYRDADSIDMLKKLNN
ncbi:tetratricopeptide repeat protein [Nonlabens sp. Asnod2-A12]|uniref:tetratricopeptide repeat protein n=1 Tax=Nonlabens sp. Asnod2-A12 TaxID=3160578 RepID=UPI003863B0C9